MFLLQLKNDFVNFISFIKRPNDFQLEIPARRKFSMIFNFLIIETIFTFLVVFPILFLVKKLISTKSLNPDDLNIPDTLLFRFLLAVVAAPIAEELLLRYPLRYNILFSKLITREKWNRIFPFLVYFLSSIFGLLHLTNYANDSWKFYALLPLILISQICGGFILSYIRIRLNIFYSILYHCIWNASFAIVLPFLTITFNDPYTYSGKHYDIKIQEQAFFNENKPKTLKLNEAGEKIYTLDAQQYQLQKISDTIYGKGKYIADEEAWINISFKSERGVTKEEFRKILQEEYTIEKPIE
ncbi:hypothetical protein ATE47_16345 [Chryseobacterium sp. IHB B 17019]|jgi:membrane protease YdiL (CAAX protease family)|uniref:CPBP family intramembrane glutamic endopeptidase n=1 Tax=Chryseobacterium sp. IHB B 17019 TaxID=1721091 RepID=UPI0007205FCF|nr:CPBP family intramembrane glutamic endopeptidase [Chryseobacterium sp. IHB B 17019]ALR31991.1 hypothetical protein ATE47_16345 [Chryseobacterium sp. IHB B 17019]